MPHSHQPVASPRPRRWTPPSARRRLLALVGASFAWATLSGCPHGDVHGPAHQEVPAAVDGLESAAEDAYDEALAGRRDEVARLAQDAQRRWREIRTAIAERGAEPGLLASVDEAISGLVTAASEGSKRPARSLARQANRVSAPMADIYALFHPATPPALLTLDYLGREVVLDARAGDFAQAMAHASALTRAFSGLAESLEEVDGEEVAALYTTALRVLRVTANARAGDLLERYATFSLELVDDMERLWRDEAAEGQEEEDD